jgi:hypothetical protein
MAKRPSRTTQIEKDPISELFAAWRLWLLGAVVGAALGWAVFQLAPPLYRSVATVVVDQNLEEAWQFFPDRQLFQFLQRETERLEQVAWSDVVMHDVASNMHGYSVAELRGGMLQLSQPSDGGWHFYANAKDAATAQHLAATWAQEFVEAAEAAVEVSPSLEAARAELSAELAAADPDEERVQVLLQHLTDFWGSSKGVSMYTELYVSQAAELPTERSVSQATYLLLGSAAGALAAALFVLLAPPRRGRR